MQTGGDLRKFGNITSVRLDASNIVTSWPPLNLSDSPDERMYSRSHLKYCVSGNHSTFILRLTPLETGRHLHEVAALDANLATCV